MGKQSSAWALLLWAALVGCGEPLQAPSAFNDERYLCDTPEFDAMFGRCREGYVRDRSCVGLVSFRGIIDAQAVVVDSLATKVQAPGPPVPGGGVDVGLGIWGHAPYFSFRFAFGDPARVSGGSVGSATMSAAAAVDSNADLLNIEARGGNYLALMINERREIQILESDEIRFKFSADIVQGGNIDGCVDVFRGNQP